MIPCEIHQAVEIILEYVRFLIFFQVERIEVVNKSQVLNEYGKRSVVMLRNHC